MTETRTGLPLKIAVAILFVFLLAPVLVIVPLSFSGETTLRFPPSSWSLRWYAAIFANGRMLEGFRNSLILATLVTAATLLIALPASYVIVRLKPRGVEFIYNLFTAPLLLPTIVLGLAILITFASVGLLGTFTGIALGHLVLTLPYALRILVTALGGLPIVVEEAAATLGARPLSVFCRVTLPLIAPGLLSAGALSFLVSFDEIVITLFLAGPRVSTLPVEMFRHLESRSDPLIAAIAVLMIVMTLAVVTVVHRSIGLSKGFLR
ncbi:ABC transporter permease [Bosea sp. 685]|uniref:ABC transporter permease n=1 Tax=Bosea sp. 685 TaxID=3080057 RepID=UPI002892D3DB|nr:ABC transporter permease [Bosea sp. 685]WNJ88860.1 ABC transporter permease [Bosea sp. 685]